MSGWTIYHWAGAAIAALALLTGLFCLVRRPQPGEPWWRARLNGVVLIVFGLIMLLYYVPLTRSGSIGTGIIFLWYAFWILLVVPRLEARRQEEHEEALAYLAARVNTYSPPAYDEELRALRAEAPKPARPRERYGRAAFLTLFGGSFLVLAFIPPR